MPKPTKRKKKPTTKTPYTGVYKTKGGFKIRVTGVHPVTGRSVARQRNLTGVSARQAADQRELMQAELLAELQALEAESRVGRATTFADYVEQWLEQKASQVRPSVLEAYISILGKRVLPVLGHIEMTQLRRSDVIGWVTWAEEQQSRRGQQYAAATLHGWWRVLACCLRDVAAELDLPDPTRRVKPPQSQVRNVTEGRALSAEQLRALLDSVQRHFPDWYPEVFVLAYTGMRPSELYALEWDDIDLSGRFIEQQRSVSRLGIVNPPKTKSVREIALTEHMVEVLTEHRQRLLREQHPGLTSGIVFPNADGGHRLNASLRKTLRLCALAADIPIKVGPKTLRKTWITLAALSGHDRLAIRSNVGHTAEEMTERYAWVSTDEKRRVVEGIEALVAENG